MQYENMLLAFSNFEANCKKFKFIDFKLLQRLNIPSVELTEGIWSGKATYFKDLHELNMKSKMANDLKSKEDKSKLIKELQWLNNLEPTTKFLVLSIEISILVNFSQ